MRVNMLNILCSGQLSTDSFFFPPVQQGGFFGVLMSKHYPGDNSRDRQMESIAQQLPDDHRILDAAYATLLDLNHACIAGDADQRDANVHRFEACIWKLNGNTFFGCNAGEKDAACVISRYCCANEGAVPVWGQEGQFIIESAGGLRAWVKIEAGCMIGYLSASFNAVDLDKPFISETGYRSYFFRLSEVWPGETVETHSQRILQSLIDARKKPLFIDSQHRDRLASEILPEWMKQIIPPAERTPQTLPEGFVRLTTLLPASKAFMARKWSAAAQERITEIMVQKRAEQMTRLENERTFREQLGSENKLYKQQVKKIERYREFYPGARCEVTKVKHPVLDKNIGNIVKIDTIYESGMVLAHDDKPIRYRYNSRGRQVVEYDPACIKTIYHADDLRLLEENDNG